MSSNSGLGLNTTWGNSMPKSTDRAVVGEELVTYIVEYAHPNSPTPIQKIVKATSYRIEDKISAFFFIDQGSGSQTIVAYINNIISITAENSNDSTEENSDDSKA